MHVDTTRLSEPRLRELWAERSELTDEAREAIRAECIKRGLRLKGLGRQPGPEATSDPAGAAPKPAAASKPGEATKPGDASLRADAPERSAAPPSATIQMTLPPVYIHPSDRLHVVDLRAIDDLTEALGTGVRLGVEMGGFLREPHQRSFAFSPSVTQALIADGSLLAPIKKLLRLGLPLAEKVTGTMQVRKGEVGIFVPSAQLVAARAAFEAVDVVPIAETEKLGPEHRDRHVIRVPVDKAEVHCLEDVGIAITWKDELILDLRRISTNTWVAFAVAEKVLVKLPVPARRTWIVPTWAENIAGALHTAREVIAKQRPRDLDQIAFDKNPPPELVRWVEMLPLPITNRVASDSGMGYPELAQNVILADALAESVRGRRPG